MWEPGFETGRSWVAGSHTFRESENAVWGTTPEGDLVAARLYDQTTHKFGSGYTEPVAVLPLSGGLLVAVVEAAGSVLVADRRSADRAHAGLLGEIPDGATVVRAHPDPDTLLALTSGAAPRLVSCALATGAIEELATISDARTFTVDQAQRRAVVLSVLPDGTSTLTAVDLDGGGSQEIVSGAPGYDWVTTAPDGVGPGLFVSAGDDLVLLDANGSEVARESFGAAPSGLTTWGSLALTTSGTQLLGVDWDLDAGQLPMQAPLGPLYVSGYARVVVDLPALGLSPGDVTYEVREGTDGGSVSLGAEPARPDGTEAVMVLAGIRPGEFHLEAMATDGTRLATRRFRVTRLWPDDVNGPPVHVTGNQHAYLMSWGGVGGVAGYLGKPAPNSWHVLTVLVELKTRAWGGLEVGARDEWKDRIIGGGESVRSFYEEASAYQFNSHGTTIELVGNEVQGPVKIDAEWSDVFKQIDASDPNSGYDTKSTGWSIFAGAISDYFADLPNGAALMDEADTIHVVVRSGTDDPVVLPFVNITVPALYAWGHASRDAVPLYRKTPTTYTQFALKLVVMTDHYPTAFAARNPTRTLSHELGHTLGLADLYNADHYVAEIQDRFVGGADLMNDSQSLPHFSLANRMRLGWADRAWLRRFDFAASPTGGTVELQATETLTPGGPTGGRAAGIEVPITDDWSYLFEYRRTQPGAVGDQSLSTSVVTGRDEILIGTDVRSRGGEVKRPPILALPKDVDGDGARLVNVGQDYRDDDTTNPQRTYDFTATLQAIGTPGPDSATVDVTYLAAHRPQLQIRPAPGSGNYKSPDIDLIGPHGDTVPYAVKGAPNTIRFTVHNLGSASADKVQVHVKWLPFTATAGTFMPLDDPAPFSVPAGLSTTVAIPWNIPESVKIDDVEVEHFCVRVDVDRYADAAHPGEEEIVVFDNWAQSNFDTRPVGMGSPSDRIATVVLASNPLERPATYLFEAHQDTDWYRVYLGNAWLELEPGQTRALELAYESLAGDPVHGAEFDQHIERITSTDHHVAITSSLLPEGTDCGTPAPVFGAGLTLRAGHHVVIDGVRRNGELVQARVSEIRDGAPHPMTFGEFHLAIWPLDEPERVERTVGTIANGIGRVLLGRQSLQDLADGRRVGFCLCRPGDNWFAAAFTPPTVFE